MLIDTHAHINFKVYKNDADEVIRRSLENDTWIINVGSQYSTSERAVEIANKYKKGIYAAVGMHPIHVEDFEFDKKKFKKLAKDKKAVAIGETGLDHYHIKDEKLKKKQKQIFRQHIELANDLNKPIIFHCRKAYDDLLSELQATNHSVSGVLHCYMGKKSMVEKFLDLGFYLGFDGPITYCSDFDTAISKTPLNKILIETDSPYLTPVPHKGERNEPLYVKYVAQKIAKIKNISFQEVAQQTTKNAKKLFSL